MCDKYIDIDETQTCGPYAAAHIGDLVVGLDQDFDAGLKKLQAEPTHATAKRLEERAG